MAETKFPDQVDYLIPKGWTTDEVVELARYAKLSKTPRQIQVAIFEKLGRWHRMEEILRALKGAGIKKKLLPQRIGFFDIETTNLDADYGFVLNWYIKYPDRHNTFYHRHDRCKPEFASWKISQTAILGKLSDFAGIKKLLRVLKDFDLIVGHYSSRFDIPYVKTKALAWVREGRLTPEEVEPLMAGVFIEADNYDMARKNLKLHSNRQESIIEMFNTGIKTRLDPKSWTGASHGDKAALDYVDEHCRTDVQALERNWDMMAPFLPYKYRTALKDYQFV